MLALGAAVFGVLLASASTVMAAEDPPPPATTTTAEITATPATGPGQVSADPARPTPERAKPSRSAAVVAASAGSVTILDGSSTSKYRFAPSSITVNAGDAVTWTNMGHVPEGHTVSGNGFDSGTLHGGASYTHTFNSPGTFNYVCHIHPFMKGKVVVEAASSGGNDPTRESGGGSPTPKPAPTPANSESAAGAAPDAGGTDSQLPSTGLDTLPLLAIGIGLFLVGLGMRRLARALA